MARLLWLVVSIGMLSGCAETPDVVYKYYPAKSSTTISVTQAISCNAAGTSLFTTEIPSVSTTYFADYSKGPYAVAIQKLDNPLADTDIGFKFTDDGRLASINQTTAGEAGAAIKSALSLMAAVFAAGGAETKAVPASVENDCAKLKKLGGGKPVPLIYAIDLDLADRKLKPFNLGLQNVNDPTTLSALDPAGLPALSIAITKPVEDDSGAALPSPVNSSQIALPMQRQLAVSISFRKFPANAGKDATTEIYATDNAVVPDDSNVAPYILPIPKAALFGSENFALTVNASGAITSIEYGKHSGASSALDAATSTVTTGASAQTDALTAQTASMKAQDNATAEAIAHAQCQTNPSTCK